VYNYNNFVHGRISGQYMKEVNRMSKSIALILSLALIISMAGCGVSAKGGSTADATSTNEDGVVVAATEKASGITEEDLTNGVIYNRSDMSDAFWDDLDEGGMFSRREIADMRFLDTMKRPYTSERKLQIAPTYSFYMRASDMFHVTINKDSVFYPVKDTILTANDKIELAYLDTSLFYSSTILQLEAYEDVDAGDYAGDYDLTLAKQERDGEKYTTKELNGWRVILTEAMFNSNSGDDKAGFYLTFFYELNEYYFITCESALICDQAGADLFVDKFTNNFVFEKVDESAAIAGVEIDNFNKIKLSDNIMLNLENGRNFGVLVPEHYCSYATMVDFAPNALTFDGVDTTYIKAVELDKTQKDTVYGDTSYTYRDSTYKGIKTTLQFYDSEYDIIDMVTEEETGEVGIKTKLVGILFETDSFIYALYPMSAEGEITTDQDYEAYVTLVMDRMLEVS